MEKKIILAQLLAKALDAYRGDGDDILFDSLWLMNGGLGNEEEEWETFDATFKEIFGISYDKAKNLSLF